MPKTPTDYSKAIIYSIICKTDDTLLYIGSTTNFTKRKSEHKSHCHNEKQKSFNFQVYVMIRTNGGWDNFEMKPVKEHPCNNKIQLLIEEEKIRKEMNANLNTNKAHMTKREYYEENKIKIQENQRTYNVENREKINEMKQKYKENHKEQRKETLQRYGKNNKEKLSEKQRQYRAENKEKINEKQRQYRKAKELKNPSKDLQNVA